MMQCLADNLRDAQARNQAPDKQDYLACVRRLQNRVL